VVSLNTSFRIVLLPLPLSPVIYSVLKFLGIFKWILTVSISLLIPKSSITSLLIVWRGLTVYFLFTSIYSTRDLLTVYIRQASACSNVLLFVINNDCLRSLNALFSRHMRIS